MATTKCLQCLRTIYAGASNCSYCGARSVVLRTQKSKGIWALKNNPYMGLSTVSVFDVLQKQEDVKEFPWPIFARPAPSLPRHGYIDSRLINSQSEAKALLAEVLADDSNGELIMCAPIQNVVCSAIWTPGSLVLGGSNDGATQGKNTITVPLTGNHNLNYNTTYAAGLTSNDWPYIEVVYTGGQSGTTTYPLLTQLRSGPKLNSVLGNYVPFPMLVKKVIKADPSKFKDRDWELEMEAAKGQVGVVVWHPGGAMIDHFSIHAVLSDLPILFDKVAPEVGSILEPTGDGPITFDPHAMLAGFVVGNKIPLPITNHDSINMYGKAALVALHHATAMRGESAKWIGMATAILLRLGVAALNGEARHLGGGGGSTTREQVYEVSGKRSLSFHRARINRLINVFRYGRWQSAGFGGLKWACCGATVLDVFNAVYRLAKNQTTEAAADLVKALNLMVNQAHNGGWWFNKFLPENLFSEIAQGYFAHTVSAGPAFYALGRLSDSISTKVINTNIEQIAKWGEAVLAPPRINTANIFYSPEINSLEIRITSKLLKSHFKPIYATGIEALSKVKLKEVKSKLFLTEGDDGYILELKNGEVPQVIWQDASLRALSVEASKQQLSKL